MRGDCMPIQCHYYGTMDEDGEIGELREISEIEIFEGAPGNAEAFIPIPSTKTITISATIDYDAYWLEIYGTNNSRKFKGLPLRRGMMNWRRWRKK